MQELQVTDDVQQLATLAGRAGYYAEKAKAPNTLRAYRSDWAHFTRWCTQHHQVAVPAAPITVALYIADMAAVAKVSTIERRLAAVSKAHEAAGYESPCSRRHAEVTEVLDGIRREKGVMQIGKKALSTEQIRRMVRKLTSSSLGKRDRALLLLGFAGGFRRQELSSLDIEDLDFREDGLVVLVRRSKSDQRGQGRQVGIPYGSDPSTCPVRAMKAWLSLTNRASGPVFVRFSARGCQTPDRLGAYAINLVVKRSCLLAGVDPADYGAHSLRAGLVTEAIRGGASDYAIMDQTGHRSSGMIRRYRRETEIFKDNAATKLGL